MGRKYGVEKSGGKESGSRNIRTRQIEENMQPRASRERGPERDRSRMRRHPEAVIDGCHHALELKHEGKALRYKQKRSTKILISTTCVQHPREYV